MRKSLTKVETFLVNVFSLNMQQSQTQILFLSISTLCKGLVTWCKKNRNLLLANFDSFEFEKMKILTRRSTPERSQKHAVVIGGHMAF